MTPQAAGSTVNTFFIPVPEPMGMAFVTADA